MGGEREMMRETEAEMWYAEDDEAWEVEVWQCEWCGFTASRAMAGCCEHSPRGHHEMVKL